jgi:hypothetical protein
LPRCSLLLQALLRAKDAEVSAAKSEDTQPSSASSVTISTTLPQSCPFLRCCLLPALLRAKDAKVSAAKSRGHPAVLRIICPYV